MIDKIDCNTCSCKNINFILISHVVYVFKLS